MVVYHGKKLPVSTVKQWYILSTLAFSLTHTRTFHPLPITISPPSPITPHSLSWSQHIAAQFLTPHPLSIYMQEMISVWYGGRVGPSHGLMVLPLTPAFPPSRHQILTHSLTESSPFRPFAPHSLWSHHIAAQFSTPRPFGIYILPGPHISARKGFF